MNARNLPFIYQLLSALRRDLADNALDQAKVAAKLAELQTERGAIEKDITGLERRIEDEETKLYY